MQSLYILKSENAQLKFVRDLLHQEYYQKDTIESTFTQRLEFPSLVQDEILVQNLTLLLPDTPNMSNLNS